jgi:hypothetical protein
MDGEVWGVVRFMRFRRGAIGRAWPFRYLSEPPWAPQAIADNEKNDGRGRSRSSQLLVTSGWVSGLTSMIVTTSPEVSLPQTAPGGEGFRGHPMGVEFLLRFLGGRIPLYGAVRWQLPEGHFTHRRDGSPTLPGLRPRPL